MPERRVLTGLRTVILWLEENAENMPSLPDTSDADMALMYLRHLEKHLEWETP